MIRLEDRPVDPAWLPAHAQNSFISIGIDHTGFLPDPIVLLAVRANNGLRIHVDGSKHRNVDKESRHFSPMARIGAPNCFPVPSPLVSKNVPVFFGSASAGNRSWPTMFRNWSSILAELMNMVGQERLPALA